MRMPWDKNKKNPEGDDGKKTYVEHLALVKDMGFFNHNAHLHPTEMLVRV